MKRDMLSPAYTPRRD
ncbi:hypothetical protein D0884_26475 (plasmid) [Klebsiella pneumoniae]|nr:hypothetical protein D0884_26475 [Klebsiella pneumoniae]MBZ7708000.1 hypothetical protein [Klebsiella oxytoca]